MDDIVKEFLVESTENLDRLDRDLVRLEEDPKNGETITSIFRTIHTIKGTSGFLAFKKLEALTHVAENLLSKLRDGAFAVNEEITSALLSTTDAVRKMLGIIEQNGTDGEERYADLVDRLVQLNESNGGASRSTKSAVAPTAHAEEAVEQATPIVAASSDDSAQTTGPTQDKPVAESIDPSGSHAHDTNSHNDHDRAARSDSESTVDPVSALASKISDSTIRVDVELLEKLMNLVGELVLARNQVIQFTNQVGDVQFQRTAQRLNLVTTELQESVMKTRMQQIGNVWSKFPRVVRDLAVTCKKKVRVEMEGKETDLDRSLLEAIKDPLTHIVRNSVDHGIETPEVRVAAGKSAEGTLKLRAYHEGGQVNIEIVDDGGGINIEKVKAKAIQQGLLTQDQAAKMGEREAVNLIFHPGLSTADKVTNISGRGVGMDVVKSNIEKIGGAIDIQSKLGEGTTIKIKIPLTLAIIPALTVLCHGDRYAIPQVSLLELVRLDGEAARKGIENLHGSLVHRLRGQLLPLVFLADELGMMGKRSAREVMESITDEINIVVLQADGRPFGLVVDRIQDTEEIVVKPLGKHIKNIAAFAGTTIMGDGRVALILDVPGIASRAGIDAERVRENELMAAQNKHSNSAEWRTLLVFQAGADGRMAFPIGEVSRLEEIKRESIELAGDTYLVQYRGEIMPLIDIGSVISVRGSSIDLSPEGPEIVHVVVYTCDGRNVGLLVGRILDIVEEQIQARRETTRAGVSETLVVQGKITEVIDLKWVFEQIRHLFTEATLTGSMR